MVVMEAEPVPKTDNTRAKRKSLSRLAQRKTVQEFIDHIKQENAGVSGSRIHEIHIAEEFLKSLPELSYHVTKINQWGKHQPRVVRLTSAGIENVRAEVVSSSHMYGEVQSVNLRNLNTFVIQYLHAEHDYVYRSPIAVQIVHEISTRVALRRTTDKKKSSSLLAFEFAALQDPEAQKALMGENGDIKANAGSIPIPSLPAVDDVATPTDGSSLSISSDPHNRLSSRKSLAVVRMSRVGQSRYRTHTSVVLNLSTSSKSTSSGSPLSSSPPLSASLESDANKRAAKLTKVLGTPQETRLHAEVDKLLWNEATPEGRTVSQFVSDFQGILKNPQTCLANVRKFLDSMRAHIIDTRGSMLVKLVVNSAPDLTPEQTMGFIVERSLEQAVVGRLHKQLFGTVTSMYKISDEQLSLVTAQLRSKNQNFFGIPDDIESSSGWSASRLEMRQLNQADTPSNKLAVILAAAKTVYSTANYEQSIIKKKAYVLSADDFLPIFMFIIIQSEAGNLESTNQFLWQLCDPMQLSGEGGYYLTVFSSIVSLFHRINITSLPTAACLDDVIQDEDAEMANGNVGVTPEDDQAGKWKRKVKFWK